jgi:two-component system cell cycle sensor histidine kinase/response regulator CckA
LTQPRSLHDGAGPPGAPVLSLPFSPGDIRILGQRKPGLRLAAVFLLAASLLFGLALVVTEYNQHPGFVLAFLSAAATLTIIAGGLSVRTLIDRSPDRRAEAAEIAALLGAVPFPALLTDLGGRPLAVNQPLRDLLGLSGTKRMRPRDLPAWLSEALSGLDPDHPAGPGTAIAIPAPQGKGPDWSIRCRSLAGPRQIWQVRREVEGAEDQGTGDLACLDLAPDGAVSALSDSARTLLGHIPRTLADLFPDGVPAAGQIVPLRTAAGPRRALVTDLADAGGTRTLALTPVGQGTGGTPATAAPPSVGASDVPDLAETDWDTFDNLPVPLLWLSADGHVRRVNRNALALIGPQCRPGAYLGDMTEGLGRPIMDWLDEAVSGHRINSPEFLRVTTSEAETFVQMTLKPVADGTDTALLAVLSDATELKTLEAQFVQSQKMQAIGQLAGGVAHDFNNLLTAISGHCDLLLLRHDQGDPDYADLMQINQNANRAAALVNQLLAFSRKQTLRPEEIDLRETVSDLTHLLNRLVGEKITLSFSHDPVLTTIRADKRQLEQVLVNLVVNARDAIAGIGEIRIVTEGIHHDAPFSRDRVTVPPGDYVAVKVIDTGCGIPPDRLSKVFEPFYTTKRIGEGTGLGLSTAYGIIKQTGGYIFVDSTPGEGACFTLLFRAFRDEQRVMKDIRAAAKPSTRHADGVVMLVEDEAPVRAFASRALRLRGYTVLEAESGEEALDKLAASDARVDIIVSDVVMPGMDGPTWVRRAMEDRPDLRVIFVSGYAEENFIDEQTRIPNSVFLPKPFSLSELTQTVQSVADGKTRSD